MKKILFATLLLFATALIAVSCGDDDDDDINLSVIYTPADIPAEGGTTTFKIECNTDWTITSDSFSWLTPDKKTGSGNATVIVTVAANTGDARQGTLVVTAAGSDKSQNVVIKQLKGTGGTEEVTLFINYTPVDIPAEGGTTTFTIESNSDWEITADSWLSPDKPDGNGNDTILVTVSANTGDARQGTITVTATAAPDKTQSIIVNQLKYSGSSTPTVLYYSGDTFDELYEAYEKCTIIDKDGDGVVWTPVEFQDAEGKPTGDFGIVSWSWISSIGVLTPEDYLILPAQTIGTDAKFTVNLYASDESYYQEKFKLIVSKDPITDSNCRNAEVVYDGILTNPDQTDYEAEIPASYNDGTVYLGICHYNSTDEFTIVIQSMTVTHTPTPRSNASIAAPAVPGNKPAGVQYIPAYKYKN